jgi:hypothetical protein
MFDFAITGLTVVTLVGMWSRLRYGFFNLFCFATAFLFALVLPPLISRYFPLFEEVGGAPLDAGGALIGCLAYDHFLSSRR